ncbi:hypothetical protein Tdes44962_MAKER03912 [Teratosphaeria destructans]|uniref:Uncharacterized protein n=1 Tax=Teratosphaeria destructans TaxID=418781 RepID=A0A9W7SP98_9PEZI|nr:hypothetical protein Tdes44962_MAKER03912 [Teratosphaeria destructans]
MDFLDFPERLIIDEQALARKRSRQDSRADSGYASGGPTSPLAGRTDHHKRPRQLREDQEMIMGWHRIPVRKPEESLACRGRLVQKSVRHVRCCGRPWLDEIQYNFVHDEADYDADDEEAQSGDPWILSEHHNTTIDVDTICSRCLDRLAVSVARLGLYDEMLKGAANGKRLSVSVKLPQGQPDPSNPTTSDTNLARGRHRASDPGPAPSSRLPPPVRRAASADVTRWHQRRVPLLHQLEHADPTTYWVAPDWMEGGNLYGF